AFNLSASARMVLDEFVRDSRGITSSALLRLVRGAFTFIVGRLAKGGSLDIDTPVARIRGSAQAQGFGIATLTALTFSLVEKLQATTLDNDPLTYDDVTHGSFELTTKELVPRVILVEHPGERITLSPQGATYSVAQALNTRAEMVVLQAQQQTNLGTFARGLQ